ncbi:DNA polymerase III subunit alpha [Bartonella schoenbuchensis]|uniref:DNA polymerase III subunit alpha n=2 Tax=Bartonella schoenbuchensis TaxID=165694 RepID=E6YZL8_BARSR|nr:DNA polymerase III subunit alpha [Bartonella schoenbuchensis]AQX30773.1 DNA polymerase III, alpha subunit [Bartonella schoenbuchensis R1]CBI82306.1 DNA polymerase III alpha subunit [Bartonella schoenbuchensis R1]CDP80188.1 DNA polymerase III subunit alpha [Bartonella schoenbuchensis]
MPAKKSKILNSKNSLPRFIHLRVHSAYSLLEGALKIRQIIQHAISDHAPAIAITDTNNLFGALEFSQYCFTDGVQPIIGCQLAIDFEHENCDPRLIKPRNPSDFASIVLFAASEAGYAHLISLVSRAYLDKRDTDPPHIKADWLLSQNEGIIALTGGWNGPINLALVENKKERAVEHLTYLKQIFGDRLYVELQRHSSYDRKVEAALVELAYEHEIPLVATNEAFFLNKEGYEAHDALMAVAEGQIVSNPNRRRVTPDHYLKSQDEMVSLFSDLPEALENSVEIALRCHTFVPTRKPILPRFTERSVDPDSALEDEAKELLNQAKVGLKMRLETIGLAEGYTVEDYEQRLDYEISVITRMQFPGYFLIVSDFIKWAKGHGIPVGPGRGSGAGSLVAYALTITDVDPLRFSLLFERFLNPDRISMPDFDIDFCQDRREEVIQYVQEKYGRDQVAQIITFGKLQARAVLRDVGRVLEVPYRQVDYLTKLVPSMPGSNIELAVAIRDEPKFKEEKKKNPVIGRMLDIALQLEGLYRHASTHAAGIVIGDRPLSELVPMYRDPRSDMPVTQFNMKCVEQAGLVKFDFLGLKTLTVLKMATDFVARKGVKVDLSHISLNDETTYTMLARGETVGVFQVESSGMRKALIGMKPDRIEDIIALVALYRPGPMENIPTYNARKHGKEEITSIHPKIDHLVKETQGVIVYQEQVMQIAQVLSGYSLGEADLLRRAMGKKIHKEMQKQRTRFVRGAVDGGIDKDQADIIFDLLAKFADYGFNKSHAAAYAIVSYQTAYMKAHHPVEFLAASMTCDMTNTDKLNDFRREALRLGIEVIAPCVQTSCRVFEIGEKCIYYSLAAIKGIGDLVVDHIVACRGDKPFKDLEDFCERIDPRIVNKRAMESLIYAGALDCFQVAREVLLASLGTLNARAIRIIDNNSSGQTDIFGMMGGPKEPLILSQASPWSLAEKLHHEFQVIGFYFSAHPLDEYQTILTKKRVQIWSDFSDAVKKGATAARLAGTIVAKQIRKTKSGKKMGVIQFSDTSGHYEAVIFSEGLSIYEDMLEPGKSFIVTVIAEDRSEGIGLRIETIQSLEKESIRDCKTMRLFIKTADILPQIEQYLKPGGNGEVAFILIQENGVREVEVMLSKRYKVNLQVANAIKAIHGVIDVELS